MDKALIVINELKEQKLIKDYAIGGGLAFLFYMEPFVTYDLDIMINLENDDEHLISLTPIYEYLRNKGYNAEAEYVKIENIPVQFIPAYNDLVKEAIENSIANNYEGVPIKVLSKEYLTAIMIQTYRPKDRERLVKIFNMADLDFTKLMPILQKFGLMDKYNEFYEKYIREIGVIRGRS